VDIALRVMTALIADVGFHPFQVFRPEADDSITGLPFKDFSPGTEALVDVVGGGAFEFAHQIADEDGGSDADGEMDVIVGAADFVDEGAGSIDKFLANELVR
jgi:hypothetical protein